MNRQLVLSIPLYTQASLADFCWGENALLKQQIDYALNKGGEKFIYLWGEAASGKSHLLQACCQEASASKSAAYLPLTLLKTWEPEALDSMDEQAFLAIDDIDAIAGNKAWEEALFHLYNRVRDNDHTILVIAGNAPPASLTIQLPDLRSRLAWGLVAQIHELNDELKINTLQQQAKKRGFELPDSVASFLLNRCSRNLHDLNQILESLDTASLAAQRKITIPFVKYTLSI